MKFSRMTWTAVCALGVAAISGSTAHAKGDIFGVSPDAAQHICAPVDHDETWYREVGDWLEFSPANFAGVRVHSETRREVFGNPVFDKDTRGRTCVEQDPYNNKLKELITANYRVGDLQEGCESNEGLLRYMKRRAALFQWITVGDWNAPKPPAPTCPA